MKGVLLAIALATISTLAAAQQSDTPWVVVEDRTYAADGKRVFSIGARKAGAYIGMGCDLSGPTISLDFTDATMPTATRIAGAYRVDSNPPVAVTWDGYQSDGAGLSDAQAKTAILAISAGRTWHVRIGYTERSIDLRGVETFADKLKESCGL